MGKETKLIKDVIENYEFTEVGEIKRKSGLPYFDFNQSLKELYYEKVPGVYLWVIRANGILKEVIYIGLTQKSLNERNKLHERGFKGKDNGGSNSGGNLKQGILKRIKEGGEIVIYFRKSKLINVMGEENISFCHIEEAALIKKFNNDSHNLMNAEAVRRRKKQSKNK
jgi:hypothetical protein